MLSLSLSLSHNKSYFALMIFNYLLQLFVPYYVYFVFVRRGPPELVKLVYNPLLYFD